MRWFTILLMLILVGCGDSISNDQSSLSSSTLTPTEEGYLAPDFTLETLDGEMVRLSDKSGSWVVLNFWATWCVPCVQEMPMIELISQDYTNQIVVYGVNMRETRGAVQAFVDELGIRFPILMNPDDATVLAYNMVSLPQTILINPQGNIVWRQFGPLEAESFRTLLDEFLSS